MKRTKVSGGVSIWGGELGLSDHIEEKQLMHNSHHFQARCFVEIDFSLRVFYMNTQVYNIYFNPNRTGGGGRGETDAGPLQVF